MDKTLPQALGIRLQDQLGAEFTQFVNSLQQSAPVSVRINPGKSDAKNIFSPGVLWEPNGYYLDQRPQFTLDPLIHAGAYYVQEASSMFTGYLLKQLIDSDASVRILDLCGAPGGKSTHIASLLNSKSLLVSNEVIRSRASVLTENLIKWGIPNVVVTQNDPRDFQRLPHFFDVVIIDAPCSGEGLFRRDTNAISEWSVENTHLCSLRQQRIVADSWEALKPGGYLIYSTCTFNPDENEQNIAWILNQFDAESVSFELPSDWGIEEVKTSHVSGYRFLPHKVQGEGFFTAVVQKGGNISKRNHKAKKEVLKAGRELSAELATMLLNPEGYAFFQIFSKLVAFPNLFIDDFKNLLQSLNVIHSGIPMVEIKGKKLIPQHELALSTQLKKEIFSIVELDEYQALRYLHREPVNPSSGVIGINLVTYRGFALGWINKLGTRSNNNYPQNWRIRMNLPDYKSFTSQSFL